MKACGADPRWTKRKDSKINARMTGFVSFSAVVAVLSLLEGCAASSIATDRGGRQAVESAMRRYVEASNRGDVTALASLYAEDAMLLPPDHEPIRGRDAITAFWKQGTDQGLELNNLSVEVDGNLGYLVGQYHLPATDEEPADSGKYVMCLKRQRDGSWKVTADIWNQSGDADDDDDDSSPPPAVT